jgi:hypothetical protein
VVGGSDNQIRRVLTSVVLLLLLLSSINARSVTFSVSLRPDTIELGQAAKLTLHFAGGRYDRAPSLPRFSDLEFRNPSESVQMSIVNGAASQTVQLSYTVIPLAAKTYTIPPFAVMSGGARFMTPAFKLTVKPKRALTNLEQKLRRGYYAEIVVAKTNVYVGQSFLVVPHLYFTSADNIQLPSLATEGFTFTNLPIPPQQRKRVGSGVMAYRTFPKVAVPIRAGTFDIGPMQFPFHLLRPIGGGLFQRYSRTQATAVAPAVEVTVKSLPTENRPAGFGGAVGQFRMNVQVGPTNLVAGDPITLKVRISGAGPFENVSLPSFKDWDGFKVYPANSEVQIANAATSQGMKSFEQVIVPQKADTPGVPEITFSFFDPYNHRYTTLRHPATPITVAPAASASQPTIMLVQTNNPGDGPKIATELVHIKPHLGVLFPVAAGANAAVWFLPTASFLLWIGMLVHRRNSDRLANDPRLQRKRATDKQEVSDLETLSAHATAGDGEPFFGALFRLLQERIGERLDLPASAITHAIIDERLKPAGADDELVANLHKLFGACDRALYAPTTESEELQQLADSTRDVLIKLRALRA